MDPHVFFLKEPEKTDRLTDWLIDWLTYLLLADYHLQTNQMIQIQSIVLLGPISAFCHMREWWPMLLHHNRNRFRPFPAQSND